LAWLFAGWINWKVGVGMGCLLQLPASCSYSTACCSLPCNAFHENRFHSWID
jgi:hypothetical protein